ncbi:MAG TPA: ORF6N domain-containing protein [Candidatus Paceibacterota bacterium]|nr:ORF6N domain-containing protein [Candidatus Paceibacterota bacterium]
MSNLIPAERIDQRIYILRRSRIMLDADLAELYGVPTKALNQAVKRNRARFPKDFMFQLNSVEARAILNLRSQNVTSSHGGQRHLPYVFTEHGAVMLANVLKSRRAIGASIHIVRASGKR